jgi:hypothetical protein
MRIRRFSALVTGLFLALAIPLTAAAPVSADPGSDEAAFVAKINALRASKGLPSLQVDAQLTGIGRSWSIHMANANGISHNPNLAGQVTSNWQKLGENVGVGGDVQSLFDAFVASPEHYRNLVDPDFRFIGVGVVYGNGRLWTSHEFMTLRTSVVRTPPAAAPKATTPVANVAPATQALTQSTAPAEAPPADAGSSVATSQTPPAPEAPEHTMHSLAQLRSLTQ